jgi:diguanylate cyclase (GGDEF)-like protein
MLAIVLPLAVVTFSISAARVADHLAIRRDVAGLRDSAFRSIYAERYARNLHSLLKVSFDHLAGRGEGFEAVASARARMVNTLERLRPFVHEGPSDDATISELTMTTLAEWEKTQEQVDIYLRRAIAFAQKGEAARARHLVTDELEVLVRSRIFSSIALITQREQELIEEYRVRVTPATEHWLARTAGAIELRERLLPDIYEAILAERFARNAYAEFKYFTYYVLEGRSLDASHGIAAGQAIARLSQLQRDRGRVSGAERVSDAAEPAETYALIRETYAHTLALPAASRRSNGRSITRRLGAIFDQSLLPHTNAIVGAHEQSIESELARLDHFVQGILSLTTGVAVIALLLGLGSSFLASRLIVRPVVDLLESVSRFRAGDKNARPSVRPKNELGLLAFSLSSLLDELQQTDRKVRALALYDSTTGLPNRQFFQERLAGALVTARLQGRAMALLTVKLDGLKQVDETLGHRAGDELVRQAAVRLREIFRLRDIVSHSSQEESMAEVSHQGGEEFTVLLTKINEASHAAIAAQRVLSKIGETFTVETHDIVVSTSIGIGIYPQDGGEVDTLMRNSNAAMNEARKRGGNLYQFYSEALNVANSRKLQIRSRLSSAIERDDLTLHYQPIHDAKYGHVTGAEPLLRWVDSELGPIGPDEFIPIAEHSGLISGIGRWVLSTACDQARAWREAGYAPIRLSVNVSPNQLRDENWVDTVATTLRKKGVSPGCLELEITETAIIQDDRKTIAALTELSDMGVGIALDDFGTGYSSLAHLRRLPISRVKIDRRFVSEISDSEEGAALTRGIVALVQGLQLRVVAEGVETHEQAEFLRSSGCDEFQGYLISRAVPAAEFERLLAREKPE